MFEPKLVYSGYLLAWQVVIMSAMYNLNNLLSLGAIHVVFEFVLQQTIE